MAAPNSARHHHHHHQSEQQGVTRNQYQPPPNISPSNLRSGSNQQQQQQSNGSSNLDYRLNPEHFTNGEHRHHHHHHHHNQQNSTNVTPQRHQPEQQQQIQELIHQHQPQFDVHPNNNNNSAILNESHSAYVPVIVIHGGASAATASIHDYRVALHEVLMTGQKMLNENKTSTEIVAECCRIMEEIPFFNAGVGSVFNCDGEHELDASLMRGSDLAAGSVAAVKTIRNPILVAKKLLERNASVLLTGEGAERFAADTEASEIVTNSFFDTIGRKAQFEHTQNLSIRVGPEANNNQNNNQNVSSSSARNHNNTSRNAAELPPTGLNNNNTISPIRRRNSLNNNHHNENKPNATPSNLNNNNQNDDEEDREFRGKNHNNNISTGTVGVVCLDVHGNIAAGTSSGGLTNKPVGRVADTGIIGSGTYAHNDFAAVSCCGSGEILIRVTAGFNVVARMRFGKQAFFNACDQVIFEDLAGLGGVGGLIACDPSGNVAMPFSSTAMPRGFVQMSGPPRVAVLREPLKTLEELAEFR